MATRRSTRTRKSVSYKDDNRDNEDNGDTKNLEPSFTRNFLKEGKQKTKKLIKLTREDNIENGSSASASSYAPSTDNDMMYLYRADIDLPEALRIYTGGCLSPSHNGGSKDPITLPRPETPYFIILFGPPGAGKSSVIRNLHKYTPVRSSDCVNISLDALVESTHGFRSKTAEIGANKSKSNEQKIKETGSIYTSYRSTKVSNKPLSLRQLGQEKTKVAKSLQEIRSDALEFSLSNGFNITYERVISDAKKDNYQTEIFEKIATYEEALGKRYKVIILNLTLPAEELVERLTRRPQEMMKQNPPFYRGIPPSFAYISIEIHRQYLNRFLKPRVDGKYFVIIDVNSDSRIGNTKKTRRHLRRS